MRRLIALLLTLSVVILSLSASSQSVRAQGNTPTSDLLTFHSDTLGVAFQYPTGWKVRELPERRTVTAASEADWRLIDASQEATGLVFSVTVSTFRQIGIDRLDDFGERLRKAENQPNAGYRQVKIGGLDGVSLEILDARLGIGGRSALVSIGQRRVAVVRGVAIVRAWLKEDAAAQFERILYTLNFFPVSSAGSDRIGTILWQASDPGFTGIADIGATADGVSIYATDPKKGLWQLSATGIVQGVQTFEGMGSYGTLGLFRDGTRYIADPVNHAVWLIQGGSNTAKRLLGGTVGVNRGQFGAESPRAFTFGYQNTINILDNIESGTRIQVFSRGGDALTAWNISPVENGAISSDALGYIYIVGRNTPGIIKLGADGKVVNPALGRFALAGTIPTAIAVDRFGAIYVATADSGVIKLDDNGKIEGVIGEAYDEAAPPKPGQLGKPSALALSLDNNILYIGDSGKYPQIMAVALSGNAAINAQSATVPGDPISYGATVNGQISNVAFLRTHSFSGVAGEVVTITAHVTTGSTLDLYLDLLDANGMRLAANDDAKLPGSPATDAQIKAFRLPTTGTFMIRVTRFGRETSSATGSYTVTLEK